jgi:hypothetical protein
MKTLSKAIAGLFKSAPPPIKAAVPAYVFQKTQQLAELSINGKPAKFLVLKPTKSGDDFGFKADSHGKKWSIARWHAAKASAKYQRRAATQYLNHESHSVRSAAHRLVTDKHLGLDKGKVTSEYQACLKILAEAERQGHQSRAEVATEAVQATPITPAPATADKGSKRFEYEGWKRTPLSSMPGIDWAELESIVDSSEETPD